MRPHNFLVDKTFADWQRTAKVFSRLSFVLYDSNDELIKLIKVKFIKLDL